MGHFRVRVAANGRLVLPASLRQKLRIEGGGQVIIREEDGRITLESIDDAVAKAQALVRQYAAGANSVVDELIAERRLEAARGAITL